MAKSRGQDEDNNARHDQAEQQPSKGEDGHRRAGGRTIGRWKAQAHKDLPEGSDEQVAALVNQYAAEDGFAEYECLAPAVPPWREEARRAMRVPAPALAQMPMPAPPQADSPAPAEPPRPEPASPATSAPPPPTLPAAKAPAAVALPRPGRRRRATASRSCAGSSTCSARRASRSSSMHSEPYADHRASAHPFQTRIVPCAARNL